MAINIISTPRDIDFAGNPLAYKIEGTNFLNQRGLKASLVFTNDGPPQEDEWFRFKQGSNVLATFLIVDTITLPNHIQDGMTSADMLAVFNNPVNGLYTDYEVTYNGHDFVVTAREEGSSYNLTFEMSSPTTGFILIGVTDGVNPSQRQGHVYQSRLDSITLVDGEYIYLSWGGGNLVTLYVTVEYAADGLTCRNYGGVASVYEALLCNYNIISNFNLTLVSDVLLIEAVNTGEIYNISFSSALTHSYTIGELGTNDTFLSDYKVLVRVSVGSDFEERMYIPDSQGQVVVKVDNLIYRLFEKPVLAAINAYGYSQSTREVLKYTVQFAEYYQGRAMGVVTTPEKVAINGKLNQSIWPTHIFFANNIVCLNDLSAKNVTKTTPIRLKYFSKITSPNQLVSFLFYRYSGVNLLKVMTLNCSVNTTTLLSFDLNTVFGTSTGDFYAVKVYLNTEPNNYIRYKIVPESIYQYQLMYLNRLSAWEVILLQGDAERSIKNKRTEYAIELASDYASTDKLLYNDMEESEELWEFNTGMMPLSMVDDLVSAFQSNDVFFIRNGAYLPIIHDDNSISLGTLRKGLRDISFKFKTAYYV